MHIYFDIYVHTHISVFACVPVANRSLYQTLNLLLCAKRISNLHTLILGNIVLWKRFTFVALTRQFARCRQFFNFPANS